MPSDEQILRHIAKVMGLEIVPLKDWGRRPVGGVLVDCGDEGFFRAESHGAAAFRWNPLASNDEAFEVLDKWEDSNWLRFSLVYSRRQDLNSLKRQCIIQNERGERFEANEPTRARAICIALYRATGGADA